MTALLQLIQPIVIFFISVAGLIALLLGALADPQGFLNQLICGVIDGIASFFPSTPDNLKIAFLVNSIGDSVPIVGRAVIREVFSTVGIIFGFVAVIKIYKLLPFKMS